MTLTVNVDEALNFHLHGYDKEHEVLPGMPTTIEFVADATGSFPFTAHLGGGAHAHEDGEAACEAAVPTGAPTPLLHLSAAADPETGMVTASVDLEHFTLGAGDGTVASGHWHLVVGGVTVGMYAEPTARVMLGPGLHELVATLSDESHCDYPVSAAVTVTVAGEGAATGHSTGTDEHGHDHDDGADAETELNLGRLNVLPR